MKTILSLICLLSFATLLNAQKAGTLNRSFGDTGVATEQNFSGSCSSLLVQSDGKLVTTGAGGYDKISGFSAYRSLSDGNADLSFGDSGRVANKVSSHGSSGLFGALQSDGKIVESGYTFNSGNRAVLTVLRYTTNGNIDSSFGTNGSTITDLGVYSQIPTGIFILTDGKIVVTGLMTTKDDEGNAIDTIFIIRYNSNGSIDNTFGNNGVCKDGNFNEIDAHGAALQPDGKILVGGDRFNQPKSIFFVKRYTSNGKIDSSFGVDGEADYKLAYLDNPQIYTLSLQPDGKILVGGITGIDTASIEDASIIRFDTMGKVDSSFGVNGIILKAPEIPGYNNETDAIIVQSDYKIIAAGSVYNFLGDSGQYTVTRYLPNGVLDSSFGVNGTTITSVGEDARVSSIALQNDDKIVLAGNVYNPTPPFNSVVLARYNNDEESKKQIIISKIKHYIQNHNNLESNSTANAKAATFNISIAPNPVNSILTINNLSANTKYAVRITNENGNTVANKQINNVSSYQINVQGLSAGVYYISITSNNNQSTTLKFIKQ